MKSGRAIIWLLWFLLPGCLDTYTPPGNLTSSNGIVVDGFLNATDRSVRVVVSATQPLDSETPPAPVTSALVTVESDRGQIIPVPEIQPGVYKREALAVDMQAHYQLKIVTKEGIALLSDFVEVREAPPIDNIGVNYIDEGVEFTVSAHDASGGTRLYRWDYEETWEYTSAFRSDFALVNLQPIPRRPGEGIYRCWRTVNSTRIMIGSSLRLGEDIISNQPIYAIQTGDQRLAVRYSTLIKQRSLSRTEYDYLYQLRLSTENVGGLFDPQPSQVRGNVRTASGDNSLVLGFFSASTVTTKRFFHSFEDLPNRYRVKPSIGECFQDTVCITIPNEWNLKCNVELKNLSPTDLITGTLFRDFSTIGFLRTSSECGDCRTQGGATRPPDFW